MKGYIVKNGVSSNDGKVFLDKATAYSYCNESIGNGKDKACVEEVQIVDESRKNASMAEEVQAVLNFVEKMNISYNSYVYIHAINGRPCLCITLLDDDGDETPNSWYWYLDTLTRID